MFSTKNKKMEKNKNLGFFKLANKSLAVLTTSLTALLSNQVNASSAKSSIENNNENLSYESFQKKIVKPKLVLKLNMSSPEDSFLTMHSSHSSHSSHMSSSPSSGHASHTSHNSHSSHYSSSPSYSPSLPSTTSNTIYSPSQSVHTSSTRTTNSVNPITGSSLTNYIVGSRNLHKGCKGTDVQKVQQLLINLGYELTADGIFGDSTRLIVMQFQKANGIAANGIIDSSTLSLLQNQ